MAIVLGKEEEKDPIRTEDKGEWFLNAKCKMQNAKHLQCEEQERR
jgi:hypothetical protein